MRSVPITRFEIVLLVALALCLTGWLVKSVSLCVAALALVVASLAVGVALPRLKMFGPFVCSGPSDRRCVALTFDDGPDPRSTGALLDLLRASNVQAAFFCIGSRVAAHPELAARIAGDGHLIENHSWSHSNMTNLFPLARLRHELDETQSSVRKAAGATPTCFRPPMGLSNPLVFRAAHDLGLRVVGWTARGFDTRRRSPEQIVNRIARHLKPGAIILLHDGGIPADRLVLTVKTLLDRLRTLDYEVVRLDRMLA